MSVAPEIPLGKAIEGMMTPQRRRNPMTKHKPRSDESGTHRPQGKIQAPRPPRTPSRIMDANWVHATAETDQKPTTVRSGKWLIFVPLDELDDAWAKVEKATEEGLLGGSSKAATARPNANVPDPNQKVICVYTYDSEDREDVMRVRQALRDLGFDKPMPYKTDQATRQGRYRVGGHKRISLYYE